MRFIARFRPSPALVVASVALLASLAGTSVAAVTLIAPNSVASPQVVDGSLLKQDFKAGQVPRGQRGARGPAGPVGPAGSSATSTATFASIKGVDLGDSGIRKVLSKNLPAGSWAVVATVNASFNTGRTDRSPSELVCELRNGTVSIGGATDRVDPVNLDGRWIGKRSLSMNGGAQVPEGGGEVSVWCKPYLKSEVVDSAQLMMIRVGGLS